MLLFLSKCSDFVWIYGRYGLDLAMFCAGLCGMVLYIKNMVCPRCVKAVKSLLEELSIKYDAVELGRVAVLGTPSASQLDAFRSALLDEGFELLDDHQSAEVEAIRMAIINWARMEGERPALSDFLQSKFLKEYSALSKLFSQMKSVTVERYAVLQRIEFAKELISYGEESLSEIAWRLGFSSLAHFSNQFKKETGMSPSQFKSLKSSSARASIDAI